MLSVDEALAAIITHSGRQPVVASSLADALGLYLAENVTADRDSPPFSKSLMDGFAVRSQDVTGSTATLTRIGEVAAGRFSDRSLKQGDAIQIMTGAPLPEGADSVVMVERTRLDGDRVSIDDAEFEPGQNVMAQGEEYRAGSTILTAGTPIGAIERSLLAAVGVAHPKVYRRPTVAVISTGDEIVDVDQSPNPGQIRNCNEWTLDSLATFAHANVTRLGIAKDDVDDLKERVSVGLASDILLLSGGVSAGKRDFVPSVLAGLGVRNVFHGVAFKPGKPMWFGVTDHGLVFGLPGNPVSVLACFEVFVKTALRARQGSSRPMPTYGTLPLASPVKMSNRRVAYHPARIESSADGMSVQPLPWKGSADLKSLTAANALVVLPQGDLDLAVGTPMSVLVLPRTSPVC